MTLEHMIDQLVVSLMDEYNDTIVQEYATLMYTCADDVRTILTTPADVRADFQMYHQFSLIALDI